MIEMAIGMGALVVFLLFVLVAVVVCVAIWKRVTGRTVVPAAAMRALVNEIQARAQKKQVDEILQDLNPSDTAPTGKTKA